MRLSRILTIFCASSMYLCQAQWQQLGNNINGEFAGDSSGKSISLSQDGSVLAVGAPNNSYGQGNLFFGHVRVFQLVAGNWIQKGGDINGEANGDFSGGSISLNANGSIIAIGAFNNDGNGIDSGHVRVFEFDGSNWVQLGVDIDGEAQGDLSGGAISLNSNGDVIAIGAANNSGNGVASGHVRIYEFNNGNWIQKGGDIDGENLFDNSGSSVSLNANGEVVAIGALRNNGNGSNAGHVRIYEFINNNWAQKGEDIDGEAANDMSGETVGINSDGSVVIIGATNNDGNGISSGHVRIYEFISGSWIQKGGDIDGEAEGDRSGSSVSVNTNGTIVAIGADANNGNGVLSGHVRVYEFLGTNWVQKDNDIEGENPQDRAGSSVGLSGDGNVVAVGSPFNAGNGANAGHVRIFSNASILGISQTSSLENNITLFPNPTKGKINLQTKNNSSITGISVVNIQGKVLRNYKLDCSSCSFEINGINEGLYFLRINSLSEAIVKKIIMK